jgi:[acyl-carrier-protein] S-malonyltransferase
MSKKAFIFPGQGAQVVGMGKDFYENFAVSKQIFEKAEDLLKYKLKDIIFNGPKDVLTLTQNSQLAIFVNSIAILAAIENINPSFIPQICAGLSLGEYTALFASKKIKFEDLLFLIQKRSKYMDEACKKNQGSMAAVLGMKYEDIHLALKELEDIWIANINTPEQIVISGKKSSVEKAQSLLKEKGAKRVIVLNVQGAFHSPYMKSAEEKLKQDILNSDILNSDIDIVMNSSASVPSDAENLKTNLIKQISSTVRWSDSIKLMDDLVEMFVEIGCGKTLTNMNKSIGVNSKTIFVEKISDLKELELCF